ncbi:MAG: site-2 protease family protein [Thermoplasmata archaeon]|nr:MAG: site-2 protease family protein [Thermoplasmata archaeon]
MMDRIEEYTIERIKSEVERYFPFYDSRVEEDGLIFFCNIDREEDIEYKFALLRENLSRYNFIPLIRKEGGEYILYIFPAKVKKKGTSTVVNLALLIATLITTTLTGSLLMSDKMSLLEAGAIEEITKFENLLNGFIQFSLPLLTILGVHEMAHYFASRKHNIKTSLPFFIPVPPIFGFNIGTFGALISSREPIHNRKALFDIGFSGPIAGFMVAIPIVIYGIMNSEIVPKESASGKIVLGSFLLFDILTRLILNISTYQYTIILHPAAFAGWVGLVITSVNLLPIGQLDGGHIARAVLGDKQRHLGWIAVITLLFTGWFAFALIIALLFGVNHPPPLNDISKVDTKRKILFGVAMIILILCFSAYPVYLSS